MLDDSTKIRKKILQANLEGVEILDRSSVSESQGLQNLMNVFAGITGANEEEIMKDFEGKQVQVFLGVLSDLLVELLESLQR